ncbi:biotin/lipoate a/B protein ligase family domain-containing protein [Ditylenchus destructor]|uniref:Octanoyl-[acyl-carrier-protein]:protein N-octanoyltransferase LIPT2, mitochondrial n=1 Tax=Ditylenchus destructor TaxID=166010 RepID=A0AAD4NIX3_9BILA|nr:biotin/lipoate a/B protein ligase family domain-containing protein [Ditylenchus destructor]
MIKALWFGRISYLEGLRIQESVYEKVKNAGKPCHYLCLFEHPPTYTVGLREKEYSAEEECRLKKFGAEFHRVKRGGLITFHGPGQIVGYPIFNLRDLRPPGETFAGVKKFVTLIEEVLIDLISTRYGVKNIGRTHDTGVWVDGHRKIAAIGIQVRHGITSHGFALNCNTDLKWFQQIIPCGLEGKSATTMTKELGKTISIEDVMEPLCDEIRHKFTLPVELNNLSDEFSLATEYYTH